MSQIFNFLLIVMYSWSGCFREVYDCGVLNTIVVSNHLRKLVFFSAPTDEMEERRGAFWAWYGRLRSKKGRSCHLWYHLGFKMRRDFL